MKVFITGATGYIGFNVALAFRRAGHEVWGLVRSQAKARGKPPRCSGGRQGITAFSKT